MKRVLFPFAACGVLMACSPAEYGEREPNDTLAGANPVASTAVVRGDLKTARDRDAFALRVQGRQLVSFSVAHDAGGDIAIDVFRDGRLVKTVDALAASGSRSGRKPLAASGAQAGEHAANFLVDGPGTVLVIHAAESDGRFPLAWTMTLAAASAGDATEREPNDTVAQASVLPENRPLGGNYSPAFSLSARDGFERDYYKFVNTTTNKTLVAFEVSGVPDVDAVLELLDDRGRVRQTIDGEGMHCGESSGPLGLESSATCLIAVRAKNFREANARVAYTIQASTRPWTAAEEFEPNDIVGDASRIDSGTELTGMLSSEADRDWYRLAVPGGRQVLSVRLAAAADQDLAFEVMDARGRTLAAVDNAGPGGAEYVANLGIAPDTAKDALVFVVRGKKGAARGTYRFVATLHEAGPFGEFEPNATAGTANKLDAGLEVRGFLYPPGDRDWFVFNAPGEGQIDARLAAPAGIMAVLEIRDRTGQVIASNAPAAGDIMVSARAARGGVFYMVVRAAGSDAGNPRDAWLLRAAFREK